ncbi:MAG: thioredoxin [Thermodesulfobacteriota bacterium]
MPDDSVIIACPRCGAKNKVPRVRINRPGERPVCGRCRAPLASAPGGGKPVNVTDDTFAARVLDRPGLTLVDFWAPWCGPCRMVAPVLEELAAKHAERLLVAKLDVDQNPLMAGRFGVSSIPTMILFKGGREVDKVAGALPRHELEALIARHL